jgi:predicted small lipoprotein YifL
MKSGTARIATAPVMLAAVIAALLGGCGTRGSLENPARSEATATADSGQGKKEGDAPKPHKGFILDGLIR